MSYHTDLRERVIAFVQNGGRKTDAVRVFNVSRATIYNWLQRPDLTPKKRGLCDRKLSKDDLTAHVQAHPDALLRERAAHFGVRTSTVWAALQQLGIRKKNDALL